MTEWANTQERKREAAEKRKDDEYVASTEFAEYLTEQLLSLTVEDLEHLGKHIPKANMRIYRVHIFITSMTWLLAFMKEE